MKKSPYFCNLITFVIALFNSANAYSSPFPAEAKSDSTKGFFWNLWWNNAFQEGVQIYKNPGGSTYALEAHTSKGALPNNEPPAAPGIIPGPITVSFPPQPALPPPAFDLKFVQDAAGKAIDGKTWGPPPIPPAPGLGITAGAAPDFATVEGFSLREFQGIPLLENFRVYSSAKARSSSNNGPNHAYGKVF